MMRLQTNRGTGCFRICVQEEKELLLEARKNWEPEPISVRLVVVQTLMWDKTYIRTKIDG